MCLSRNITWRRMAVRRVSGFEQTYKTIGSHLMKICMFYKLFVFRSIYWSYENIIEPTVGTKKKC